MSSTQNRYHWLMKIRPAFLADILKILFRIKRQLVNTDVGTFLVDPASFFGDVILCNGNYEPNMEQTLRTYLRPGDIFVDIGANEGYFCILASRLVEDVGRVIAVEPQGRLQAVLKENLSFNKCRNVTVITAAIAAQDGEQKLYLASSTNTGGSGMVRMTKYCLPSVRTQALTLSTLFKSQKIQRCRLVKIDVEGFEGEVIAGAHELIKDKRIDVIALEYHPLALERLGVSKKDIHTRLLEHSYRRVELSTSSLYLSPTFVS